MFTDFKLWNIELLFLVWTNLKKKVCSLDLSYYGKVGPRWKGSQKKGSEDRVTYSIILIFITVWCNKSRRQLRATRQTCSRICEDGFPFPGSLRRHGRAAHPAARKVREFRCRGTSCFVAFIQSQLYKLAFCPFALNNSKSQYKISVMLKNRNFETL